MRQDREYEVNKINDIKQLMCRFSADRIFIYGAGKVGLLVYFLLKQNNIEPYSFVVSHKITGNIYESFIPVLEYQQNLFDEEDIVIIAASSQIQNEIKINCMKDCCNKIIVTEKFFNKYYKAFDNRIDKILFEEKTTMYISAKEERKTVGKFFLDENFVTNKFLILIRNLELFSRENVIKCIKRVRKINLCQDSEMDIFTENEKKKILKMYQYFKNEIIQLNENIWSCGGYLLPINEFSPEIFWDKLGISEIENLQFCQCKDVIDVGGYIGDSALILSEITKRKVHVFEPVESNCEMIEETKRLNQIDILIVNKAVSDKEDIIPFSIDKSNSTSSSREIENREYEKRTEVETISIDRYVEENRLDIGLIKIHAEGLEQKVLKGAFNVIKKQAPIIITEIGHSESDFFDIKPMLEKINPNYKFKIYKPANGLACLGMKLIAEIR